MSFGTVAAIYRYPVKAMAGEPLEHADVWWFGIPCDGRYAFVQSEHTGDFPWLTIRELPALTLYRPALDGDAPPRVTTPAGRELGLTDPELAGELAGASGRRVHLHRDHRGTFDAFPISVISLQAVRALSEHAGRELDPRRFRPNVVIDAPGEEFPEDALVGRHVTLGGATVRVTVPDKRCMVVNFDHDTAERDAAVLRAVTRHHDVCAGVYGSVETPGTIRVDDPVQAA